MTSRSSAPEGVTPEIADLVARLEAAEKRITRLDDVHAIEKLTRAYGYYIDKGLWDQVVDLFSDDAIIEIEAGGVYIGREGADRLFRVNFGGGRIGLGDGRLFNHPQFQGIVDVDPDGQTAKGRWRTLAQVSWWGEGSYWNEGTYENEYIKEDGVWKFKVLRFWSTFFNRFDEAWGDQELPPLEWGANRPNDVNPPDRLSEPGYCMFPRYFVPPFHFDNPVSGRPVVVPPQPEDERFTVDKYTPDEYSRKMFGS